MKSIRVVLADDSPSSRTLMASILESDPELLVVGQAADGLQAVELARSLRPDVVVMDARMPGLDGFQATKRLMTEAPVPIVMVSALMEPGEVQMSMEALRAGALTLVGKPPGPGAAEFDAVGRQFAATIKAMAGVKVVRHYRPGSGSPARLADVRGNVEVVGIAASAGGPAALQTLLGGLTAPFPCPVLVVQHMATGFVRGFADWLQGGTSLRVRIAADHELLQPNHVYLAPDDCHLMVADGRVKLSKAPPANGFRPSASVLFDSLARWRPATTIGIILTGMGSDGVDGLRHLLEAGGQTVAQDEATSIVFGMPQAAITAGAVQRVLPLGQMAEFLGRCCTGPGPGSPSE